jgi:D-alanyl-D-alanine carboxypeptidase
LTDSQKNRSQPSVDRGLGYANKIGSDKMADCLLLAPLTENRMAKNWLYIALACALPLFQSPAAIGLEALPKAPDLAAKSWILIDAETGTVLAKNNADLPLPPASLAKMMTTYIVAQQIEQGSLG